MSSVFHNWSEADMALYMMLGKYSDSAVGMINASRTQNAVGVIENTAGEEIDTSKQAIKYIKEEIQDVF